MFFSFEYFAHPFGALHGGVRRFLWRLRCSNRGATGGKLPTAFRLADWCDGLLLERARGNQQLKELLRKFYTAYADLDRSQRKQFYNAYRLMNRIEDQMRGLVPHRDISSLPLSIRQPTKELFLHLYKETLSPSAVRRQHYKCFCKRLDLRRTHECPFCGLEDLFKEEDRLQDYDHLLGKARYPLAAINPRNLVPMGWGCNQVFKQDKPLLFDDSGARRKAFYPYRQHDEEFAKSLAVSFEGSRRPSASDPGEWRVRLMPDARAEVQTWQDVFELPHRIVEYRVRDCYDGWVNQFVGFIYQNPPGGMWTRDTVRQALEKHAKAWREDPKIEHRMIRSAMFHFLADQPDQNFFDNLASRLETRRTAGEVQATR